MPRFLNSSVLILLSTLCVVVLFGKYHVVSAEKALLSNKRNNNIIINRGYSDGEKNRAQQEEVEAQAVLTARKKVRNILDRFGKSLETKTNTKEEKNDSIESNRYLGAD